MIKSQHKCRTLNNCAILGMSWWSSPAVTWHIVWGRRTNWHRISFKG